jgi:hypothetical protein
VRFAVFTAGHRDAVEGRYSSIRGDGIPYPAVPNVRVMPRHGFYTSVPTSGKNSSLRKWSVDSEPFGRILNGNSVDNFFSISALGPNYHGPFALAFTS